MVFDEKLGTIFCLKLMNASNVVCGNYSCSGTLGVLIFLLYYKICQQVGPFQSTELHGQNDSGCWFFKMIIFNNRYHTNRFCYEYVA
jgi:hypothetical protein